jgi:hemoglobin
MRKLIQFVAVATIALSALVANAAEEKKCPVSGEPANPKCTLKYEGKTYTFCCGKCRTKFDKDVKASLYHRLGGKAAMTAAINLFYKKVLADKSVNHHFEDVNMKRQHNKQKAFLSAAFGSPVKWTGKDMRKAHKHLDLKESDFGAIAGHLQATLQELKIEPDLIKEVMTIAASTHDAVLNRPAKK